jgi:hypothetical protein
MLIRRRLPRHVPDTVEAKQAEFRAQPEITVGRLSNGLDCPFGKALADLPSRVRVLTDIQRRIQRERARAQKQHTQCCPPHGHISILRIAIEILRVGQVANLRRIGNPPRWRR